MNLLSLVPEIQNFPTHWNVVPFDDAIKDVTGGNSKVKQSDYKSTGALAVIDQGKDQIAGYVNDLSLRCNVNHPVVLFGDHTKILKFVTEPFALGADGVKVLAPCPDLDAKFAYFYLQLVRFPTGTGYSRHFKYLKAIKVPVPPTKDEQRRIAAILDKADAIRRKRHESIRLTEEFLRSTFLEMFGDPVSNPKGWDKVPLKELGNVTTGNTPSREHSEYYGKGIDWIKSDNINTPFHFLTDAKEHLTPAGQKVGRIVPVNSTLVTCIAGSPECIGNAAIANRPVAFNQQINAVTPYKGTDPYFLYVQILVAKKLIQGQSTESMKGMVNKGKFENISFLRPPANLQADFGKIFIHFHGMNQKADSSNQKSTNLFNSLVQRAFRGEL
jgi:type I restriction enzyme, S subunit